MSEVLVTYTSPVIAGDGTPYRAQACGAPNPHGLWEGWIEFAPIEGGPPLRSERETTQPNRTDAEYWATGLTPVYLEGALHRALNPLVRKTASPAQPLFQGPARRGVAPAGGVPVAGHQAVLDPFSVYFKGETLLRNELRALSPWHLVNIVLAYQLSSESEASLNRLSAAALIDIILTSVQQRASSRQQD